MECFRAATQRGRGTLTAQDPQAATEIRIRDLASQMTLAEKIGQITLVVKNSMVPEDISRPVIGGGWTIEWQGKDGAITPITSFLEALQTVVFPQTRVAYNRFGHFKDLVDGQRPAGRRKSTLWCWPSRPMLRAWAKTAS